MRKGAKAHLALLALSVLFALSPPAAYGAPIASHLTHYGSWKEADIALFQRFGMVALQPGRFEPAAGEIQAIARLKSAGTKVLLYVSIGEDATTYNHGVPARGDGRGPVRWDAGAGQPVFQNKGVASYYLDEWNAAGHDPDSVNKVPDGIPDRQGDWGSCLVNAGDPAWRNLIMSEAARLLALGADGLFLDTPETANPWLGYGWTAPGMHDLIRALREAHPGKYLLLNRGLFFFDPDHPLQYRSSPRKYLDGVLFESYYTGSNYTADLGGDGVWRPNPYFILNKYISAPRLNAEMNRPDSRGTVFHIDYAADPMGFALSLPDVFRRIRQEVVVEQGWVPQVNNRLLSLAPTAFLDNPAPADRDPPRWRNTAASGASEANPPAPRVGLLKAIPGNGQVTLRWDVAADQTWPVRYNVYHSRGATLDFAAATLLPAVATKVGADYTDRALTGADDGCPYEYTVTGLDNNVLYRFAVRAEDGTAAAAPAAGRQGPNGGIEETNAVVLMAIPRDSTAYPIAVDGAFADWSAIAAIPDPAGDGSGADFLGLSASDDRDHLYLSLEYSGAADPARTVLLFNTDRRSHTGDIAPAGSGFRGADYKWESTGLYRHQDWEWVRTGAAVVSRSAGSRLELRIAKQDLGAAAVAGIDLLAATPDRREIAPDLGLTGFSYGFTRGIPVAIDRPPRSAGASRALRFANAAEGLRIAFRNPRGRAEIRILDLRGRRLLRQSAWKEDAFTWKGPLPATVVLIQVLAEGEPVAAGLWVPRSQAGFTRP